MPLRAKAIRISLAKFHCNRLPAVQDIPDYASLIFATSDLCSDVKLHIVSDEDKVDTSF